MRTAEYALVAVFVGVALTLFVAGKHLVKVPQPFALRTPAK